ncbi:hypothetical protein HKD37_15G043496 [Glycine soja]
MLQHIQSTTINKTRTFYEFILIDSDSISIKHFKDSKEPLLNTHSTIQILKCIEIKTTNISTHGLFTSRLTQFIIYQIGSFNGGTFLDQSRKFSLSRFNKHFNSQESQILADLKYFSSFTLSWIFSWQYRYCKTENNKKFPSLQRHGFVKWWNQFDTSKAQPDKVKIWFKVHLAFLKAPDPETSLFLNQKSQLAAFLAKSNSKEHFTKKLKEVLQLLQSQEEGSSKAKKKGVLPQRKKTPIPLIMIMIFTKMKMIVLL